ncbi:MAG: Acetyltransferase (GNAT) family protein [Firmicutes bacterium ADurb.Bin182]|nr:MAG: Acetyltransferase (GNAT) family protein [Firmicutes bacterium ADurb.Bin182]
MKFTRYNTAKDYIDDVLEILNRYEIQNNLFYKNIGDDKFMASVKDDCGKVVLTAVRTSPFPMLIYETDNIRNDEAVEFFARSLVEHGINVDFIMTEKELAKSFCKQYGKLTDKTYHNNESLVLYVHEKLNELAPIKGTFRKAGHKDMFYLPYWYADFPPACNIGSYDLPAGIESASKAVENGNAYIWEDDYPVSVAASVRSTTGCAFIGQVYTPPNLRGKGYCTACVWNLSKKLLDDGFKYCALYADCANPCSNRVYQKIGYKEVFWYDQYKFVKRD